MLLMGYSYLCPNRQRNAVDKLRVRSGSSGLVASGRLTARIIAMAIDIYERIIIEEAGMGTGTESKSVFSLLDKLLKAEPSKKPQAIAIGSVCSVMSASACGYGNDVAAPVLR